MAKKELHQLSRDPRTLGVMVAMPAALLLFYGYVLSFDVKHVRLAVLDEDRSAASRSLVAALTAGEYFDLTRTLKSARQINPELDGDRATIVLAIPKDYGDALSQGQEATVQALIDGSNATSAQTAQGYIEAYVAAQAASVLPDTAHPRDPPVSARLQVLYNPDLSSTRFLLPGLVAFILMISSAVVTALSVVKERETGTMEQLLVSPLTPTEIIVGKALPYGVLAVFSAVLVMATARAAFGLRVEGSYAFLLLLIVLFVVGAQGLGLLISSITSSQQVAFQAVTFATMLPTLLLSGFIFPIRSMPIVVQWISRIVPARYFVVALRGVVLKGVGPEAVWREVVALVIFAVGMLAIAALRLRRVRL